MPVLSLKNRSASQRRQELPLGVRGLAERFIITLINPAESGAQVDRTPPLETRENTGSPVRALQNIDKLYRLFTHPCVKTPANPG
ncbi:MAG: hypothetical protein MUC60_07130 [Oscillatoria sp. Prado101]|nr:hypothetical protein [Oscillatoria sp. Prado101]